MLKAEPQFVAFAPIDLKNAHMYLRDGFNNGATVPLSTNLEPIGSTEIELTACALNIPDNACVVFGNELDEEYTVASATRTGGTDTKFNLDLGAPASGTFTLTFRGQVTEPMVFEAAVGVIEAALEALCNIPVDSLTLTDNTGDIDIEFGGTLSDQSLTITDDLTLQDSTNTLDMALTITVPGIAPTATTVLVITPGLVTATSAAGLVIFKGQKIEVVIGEGNMTYKKTKNREYVKNRGLLGTVKDADQEPVELSFDFTWDYISSICGTVVPTIEEALEQTGAASDWVNSSSDACEPYAVNIEVWNVPACTGTNVNEKFVFADFRVEALDHNLSDSQVSASGKCNILAPEIHRY